MFVKQPRLHCEDVKNCDLTWHMICDRFHVRCDIRQMTCDTWHVTHDMRHMKCDILHVTHYMRHMTYETWHVTHDMWPMPCDIWHVTHDTQGMVHIVLKCKVPSSYSLGVKVFWRYFHKWWLGDSVSDKTKLDGVGPQPTRSTILSKYKSNQKHDPWHHTPDMGHVKHDTWSVTHGERLIFSKKCSAP